MYFEFIMLIHSWILYGLYCLTAQYWEKKRTEIKEKNVNFRKRWFIKNSWMQYGSLYWSLEEKQSATPQTMWQNASSCLKIAFQNASHIFTSAGFITRNYSICWKKEGMSTLRKDAFKAKYELEWSGYATFV